VLLLCADLPVRLLSCAATLLSFFSSYRHHPDLHSFPTRRSSDLGPPARYTRSLCPRVTSVVRAVRRAKSRGGNAARSRFTDVTRSEEHTSELQSHLNLVCRLLLEKKNNTADTYYVVTATPHRSIK